MNIKNLTNEIIDRAKNTREYLVVTTVPDGFEFMGVVPFDLTIKNNNITAKVLAASQSEAESKFTDWLDNCTLGK